MTNTDREWGGPWFIYVAGKEGPEQRAVVLLSEANARLDEAERERDEARRQIDNGPLRENLGFEAALAEAEAKAERLARALAQLHQAAEPYRDKAAPHEDLWTAEDHRTFNELVEALNRARQALEEEAEVSEDFEGFPERECGDHRTVGARAWCYGCTAWCYPEAPCPGCELPALRAQLAQAQAREARVREWAEGREYDDEAPARRHVLALLDEPLQPDESVSDQQDQGQGGQDA